MMQMTDFTRGTGPLKNTSDVIEAAKDIARLGNDLEALASQISEVIWLVLTLFWLFMTSLVDFELFVIYDITSGKFGLSVHLLRHLRCYDVIQLSMTSFLWNIQACPEDWARNELSAHINKIKFYCHQLNMCAKVKAEVQNIAHELVVSGLDSATSLIQVKIDFFVKF